MVILLELASGFACAETQQAGKDFAILNMGFGGRASGMGNAQCAAASDGSAAFWNPAAMLFNRHIEMMSMQAKLPSDADLYMLSGVLQNGEKGSKADSAWGFFWANGDMANIPKTTPNAAVSPTTDVKPSDYFSYNTHVLGVSYANWLQTNLSYGLNLTGFYQSFSTIDQGTGYGLSFTPGFLWMVAPELAVGGVLRDAVNITRWATGTSETVLPELRLGTSYAPIPALLFAGEIRQKIDSRYQPTLHTGLEYRLWQFLRVRMGFDQDRISGGCGIYVGNIDIQYAYVGDMTDGIGDSHRVSFGFGL